MRAENLNETQLNRVAVADDYAAAPVGSDLALSTLGAFGNSAPGGKSTVTTVQRPAVFAPEPRGWIVGALGVIWGWVQRYRQRQALLGLDDRMLKDIGITRYEVVQEGSKWFWRG